MEYYLGIDLGGTNIAMGVVNSRRDLMAKSSVPTPCGASGEALADLMADEAEKLLGQAGILSKDLEWAGIGVPGQADPGKGILIRACNLGLYDCPIGGMLESRIGRPVYLANDANAAAYGEAMAGAARGSKSSVTVTLGTGVGVGIIIGSRIYEGHNFCAGEGGHMVILPGGRLCGCGRRGCLETYVSATGLIRSTREAMEQDPYSRLWQAAGGSLENVTGKTAWDAMAEGDPAAARVIEQYIEYLACGITNIVNLLAPETVCIGGGVSAQGETLLAPLRRLVNAQRYDQSEDGVTIVKASLGNDAGVIGAALLGAQY